MQASGMRCVRGRGGFTMVEAAATTLVVGTMIVMLLPALDAARSAADQIGCLSNHQQLAVAFATYGGDHSGRMPPGWLNVKYYTDRGLEPPAEINGWASAAPWPPRNKPTSNYHWTWGAFLWPYLGGGIDTFVDPGHPAGLAAQLINAATEDDPYHNFSSYNGSEPMWALNYGVSKNIFGSATRMKFPTAESLPRPSGAWLVADAGISTMGRAELASPSHGLTSARAGATGYHFPGIIEDAGTLGTSDWAFIDAMRADAHFGRHPNRGVPVSYFDGSAEVRDALELRDLALSANWQDSAFFGSGTQ
jgi:prepilin-type processing-associated H-X9-DG protein